MWELSWKWSGSFFMEHRVYIFWQWVRSSFKSLTWTVKSGLKSEFSLDFGLTLLAKPFDLDQNGNLWQNYQKYHYKCIIYTWCVIMHSANVAVNVCSNWRCFFSITPSMYKILHFTTDNNQKTWSINFIFLCFKNVKEMLYI